MNIFSHHAQVAYGNIQEVFESLNEQLKENGFLIAGNPDAIVLQKDTLLIDDVRALKSRVQTKAATGARRVVVISFVNANTEAQNALLKIIEEPGERTHFFVITGTPSVLLPTLKSRLQPIVLDINGESTRDIDIKKFLKSSFSKRIEILSPLIEDKQKGSIAVFLNDLEAHCSEAKNKDTAFLKTLQTIRKYFLDRGASVKMLLEFCALFAPKS